MTFKQLTNELMLQGWRAYHIEDIGRLTRGDTLHKIAQRSFLEVQVYEGKSIVFVKTVILKDEDK